MKPWWKNSETRVYEVKESQFIESKPYLFTSFKNRDSATQVYEVKESQIMKSNPYLLASFEDRDSETLMKE